MPAPHLANTDLTPADVPPGSATRDEIAAFAHRFHAYKVVGSLPKAADITDALRAAHDAGETLADDLIRLRTALFVTVRAGAHGYDDGGDDAFTRALTDRIREVVAAD